MSDELFTAYIEGPPEQSCVAAAKLSAKPQTWIRVESEIRAHETNWQFGKLAAAYPRPISEVVSWFDGDVEALRQFFAFRSDTVEYLSSILDSTTELAVSLLLETAANDDWGFRRQVSLPSLAIEQLQTIDTLDAQRLLVRHHFRTPSTIDRLHEKFEKECRDFDGDYDHGCWLQDVVMDVSHAQDDRFISLLEGVLEFADGPLTQVVFRALSRFPNAVGVLESVRPSSSMASYESALFVAAECALQICRQSFSAEFFDRAFEISDNEIFSMVVLGNHAKALTQIDPERVFSELTKRKETMNPAVMCTFLAHLGAVENASSTLVEMEAWETLWTATKQEYVARTFAEKNPRRFLECCDDEELFSVVSSWSNASLAPDFCESLWQRFPLLRPENRELVTDANWRVVHNIPFFTHL